MFEIWSEKLCLSNKARQFQKGFISEALLQTPASLAMPGLPPNLDSVTVSLFVHVKKYDMKEQQILLHIWLDK